MGKDRESSSGADTSDDVPNGETSSDNNQAAKAFDALAKALQPQVDQVWVQLMCEIISNILQNWSLRNLIAVARNAPSHKVYLSVLTDW